MAIPEYIKDIGQDLRNKIPEHVRYLLPTERVLSIRQEKIIFPKTDTLTNVITKETCWFWPYYGSIDSTLLFIRLLYRYITETEEGITFLHTPYKDKDGKERIMFDALVRATTWVLKRIDM